MAVFDCTSCESEVEREPDYVSERETLEITIKSMSGASYPDNGHVCSCPKCNSGVLLPAVDDSGSLIEFENEKDKVFTKIGIGISKLEDFL